MGFGQIIGGGPAGRYTVRIDYGEATKASTLAALNEQLSKMDVDLAAAQARLATAQAAVDAQRIAISDAANAFISAGGTGNMGAPAVQAALLFLENQRKLMIEAQKLTIDPQLKVDAIRVARAQVLDYIQQWTAAVTLETKDCWCTDYTESGAGYVATIDIDGDSTLTVLAPGCRGWLTGDGAISTARKAEALATLNERLSRADLELTKAETAALQASTAENDAKTAMANAQTAYQVAPQESKAARAKDVADAVERWTRAMVNTGNARTRQSRAQNRVNEINRQVAEWSAKPASDSPVAGDGYMRHSQVMSPEQFYWNAAVFPAWQKWKPTYRWGTLTALDKDADTATVALAGTTSSQQNLNINQASTLSNIPVVYMTCNARAFEVNDRVVVQFIGQDWGNPRVIGFLDNPRPCLKYTARYYVIGYGPISSGNNHLFDTVEKDKDTAWGDFSTVSPVSPWKFIQWSDGVTTLTRNDGTATADISRTARYTYAPDFQLTYSWTVEAYATSGAYFDGTHFVKDWEVKVTGMAEWSGGGNVPTSPASSTIDTVVWSGQALNGVNPDDVLFNLTDTYINQTSSAGPIYFPSYPASSTQTAVFVLSGSGNQYTVNGTATSAPYPGGVIPPSASGTGEVATITYMATSWSAVYA